MKKLMVLMCIMFVIVLMAITNPSKGDYISWLKETSMNQTDDSLGKGFISLIGNPLFEASTKSKNLVLFSVFETNLSDDEGINALGIGGNFILITQQSRYVILGFYLILLGLIVSAVFYLVLPFVSKDEVKND